MCINFYRTWQKFENVFSLDFRRQRATQSGNSPWEIVLESLNTTINSLQVEVFNTLNQARLQLQLIALADSTLHLQLDETNPLRPRYRVQDSLAGSPKLSRYIFSVILVTGIEKNYNYLFFSLKITEQSSESLSLSFGDHGKAVLLIKPFRLDVYDKDQLVISVNARGLLNFEHQRIKKSR